MGEFQRLPGVLDRWRFGVFEFDGHTLELTRNGRSVSVRPQPLKLLARLLARPGELVSREELQTALWGGETFVDFEQGVNHAIRELRAALGDAAESPRFIQTLPRRGYRFIPPVERIAYAEAQPVPRVVEPAMVAVTASAQAVVADTAPALAATVHVLGVSNRRRLIWAATASVVVVLTGALYLGLRPTESAGQYATLAVRPFSAPADPALGVGIANAISARLGGQQMLSVRSFSSQSGAGTSESDHDSSAWPPGATHALDGEITMAGPQVTALARLRDKAGTTLWSEQIQVRSDELFSLEDVIAERVVAALRFAWQPASRTGSVGATQATALPMAITFAVERRSSGIRRKVRWPRSTPSNVRCSAILRTHSPARDSRWPAPTCICASRRQPTSNGGENGLKRRRVRRWISIRTSRRRIWPVRRSPANASSTGMPPW